MNYRILALLRDNNQDKTINHQKVSGSKIQ